MSRKSKIENFCPLVCVCVNLHWLEIFGIFQQKKLVFFSFGLDFEEELSSLFIDVDVVISVFHSISWKIQKLSTNGLLSTFLFFFQIVTFSFQNGILRFQRFACLIQSLMEPFKWIRARFIYIHLERSFRPSNIYSFDEKKISANLSSSKPHWIQSECSLDEQKQNEEEKTRSLNSKKGEEMRTGTHQMMKSQKF